MSFSTEFKTRAKDAKKLYISAYYDGLTVRIDDGDNQVFTDEDDSYTTGDAITDVIAMASGPDSQLFELEVYSRWAPEESFSPIGDLEFPHLRSIHTNIFQGFSHTLLKNVKDLELHDVDPEDFVEETIPSSVKVKLVES